MAENTNKAECANLLAHGKLQTEEPQGAVHALNRTMELQSALLCVGIWGEGDTGMAMDGVQSGRFGSRLQLV